MNMRKVMTLANRRCPLPEAPVLSPASDIVINEGEGMLTPFRSMLTGRMLKSPNAQCLPRDMMAIFQAMKQALQAELF